MKRKLMLVILLSCITIGGFTNHANAENAFKKADGLLDNSPKNRQHMISAFAFIPWWYGLGFGVAGRYAIPIVHNGFIPRLNDSVELEFGADVYYSRWLDWNYYGFVFPVEGRWTFHLTPKFSAYGKASLGLRFSYLSYSKYHDDLDLSAIHWGLSSGILYQFNESMAFRAELGVSGLMAGIGFSL